MQGAFIYLNDQLAKVIVGCDAEGVGFVGIEVEGELGIVGGTDDDLVEDAAAGARDFYLNNLIIA